MGLRSKLIIIALFGALTVLWMFNPWANNDTGYRTYVQQIGGETFTNFEPGWYYAGFRATKTVYPDVVTVQFENEDDWKQDISYNAELITSQFKDGTYADVGFTVKWKLPLTQATMQEIHTDYRTANRLAESLADYSKECMNYSTPLMDSERHYSGGKSELKDYFQFQLRNGQYILDQEEILTKNDRGEVTKRSYENSRREISKGVYELSKSDVQEYEITPNFVAITHVDYEDIVDDKLKAKVDQSTKEAISKQTLVTAQQEALTAKAEGDRQLATTRATEEAAKLEAVIRMEKEVELSRLASNQAKYDAQKVKWDGDAKAAANQALVRAGLTPEMKAKIDKETAIGVAAEFAKMKWPAMMIFGGGNNSPTNPIEALGIESMLNIQERMMSKKKN